METERKRYAAIYVRLSSYADGDTSLAPDTQRRICEDWCAAQGYEIAATYEDLDVSGGSLDRPQMDRLRQEWGRYDVVVAAKLDRLSRSVRDFTMLNDEAQRKGCALAAVRDNLDMTTPIGRFIGVILAAFAELELATITARIREGKETARRAGRWPGGPVPFGFRNLGAGALEVDEADAEIIRQTAALRADGMSLGELVRWLSQVAPERRWTARGIRLVMTRDRLRGTVFPPAEFEAVRKLFQPQQRAEWIPRRSRLLSGMLRCDTCGGMLVVQTRTGGTQGYRCTNKRCPHQVTVSAVQVEQFVEREFLAVIGGQSEVRVRPVADVNDERAAELQLELRGVNAEMPDASDDRVAELLERRRGIHAELARLEDAPRNVHLVTETGFTYGEAWALADTDARRRLLGRFWPDQVTVKKAGRPGAKQFDPGRLSPQPLFQVE